MLIRRLFVGTTFTASEAQFIARDRRDLDECSVIGNELPLDAINLVPTSLSNVIWQRPAHPQGDAPPIHEAVAHTLASYARGVPLAGALVEVTHVL